jgi:hypothetical protein
MIMSDRIIIKTGNIFFHLLYYFMFGIGTGAYTYKYYPAEINTAGEVLLVVIFWPAVFILKIYEYIGA